MLFEQMPYKWQIVIAILVQIRPPAKRHCQPQQTAFCWQADGAPLLENHKLYRFL